jgi:hypothetical protein
MHSPDPGQPRSAVGSAAGADWDLSDWMVHVVSAAPRVASMAIQTTGVGFA